MSKNQQLRIQNACYPVNDDQTCHELGKCHLLKSGKGKVEEKINPLLHLNIAMSFSQGFTDKGDRNSIKM